MICLKYILCFQKIVVEIIFIDNKYIFVLYEGRFDANIFWYPFQIYELYFSINIDHVSYERGESRKTRV